MSPHRPLLTSACRHAPPRARRLLRTQGLMHATGLALHTLRNHREDFEEVQRRGMARDSSWDQAAATYEQIFEWALMDTPYCK